MAQPSAQPSTILRVAAAWGTTVLSVRNLLEGQSYILGEGADASMVMPDGLFASQIPVRAIQSGWELDASGATNGLLRLRGREEDPTRIGANRVPLLPGDWGLLQYGTFSVFLPTITPSWTDQYFLCPSQPSRSLPLNSLMVSLFCLPSSPCGVAEAVTASNQAPTSTSPHPKNRLHEQTVGAGRSGSIYICQLQSKIIYAVTHVAVLTGLPA